MSRQMQSKHSCFSLFIQSNLDNELYTNVFSSLKLTSQDNDLHRPLSGYHHSFALPKAL